MRMPILLVEPSSYFAHLMKAWLSEMGFSDIQLTSNLADAHQMLVERKFSLILCELNLDGATGFALAHAARRGAMNLNRMTPIIALNARPTNRRVETARDLGMSEFICKPLSRKAFEERVTTAIHQPRNFIKAADFFGPDRRRRASGVYDGEDRRAQKPRKVNVSDTDIAGWEV
jgi:DNA-binding response OmpR family regulator